MTQHQPAASSSVPLPGTAGQIAAEHPQLWHAYQQLGEEGEPRRSAG